MINSITKTLKLCRSALAGGVGNTAPAFIWRFVQVLLQDTTYLPQRPCYQRGSPCQDPTGNWTTRRAPDHRKETQTAVVWSCLPFIRTGENHPTRHNESGKKTRQTKEEVGRHQEWTCLEFAKSQRAVENRGKCRKLVMKSSVVPRRPLRLRDRWWWWWVRKCKNTIVLSSESATCPALTKE